MKEVGGRALRLFRFRPNLFYFYIALGLFSIFWLIVSLPALNYTLFQFTSFDLLQSLGSSSLIGWRKMALFTLARNIALGLTVLIYFCLLSKRGRISRIALSLPLIFAYQVTLSWPEWARLDHAFKAETQQFMTIGYQKIFSKDVYSKPEIKTFAEFYKTVDQEFNLHQSNLRLQWQVEDLSELKALFFLNVVGNLWHFGNREHAEKTGCVLTNEKTDFQVIESSQVTVRTYLDSDIACCTDFAEMLKFLLDEAKIPNRLVELPGHLANEAEFASGWHALDATTGVILSHSWQTILAHSDLEPRISFFPTGTVQKGNHNYSPAVGGLRMAFVSIAIHHSPMSPQYRYELPSFFKDSALIDKTDITEN